MKLFKCVFFIFVFLSFDSYAEIVNLNNSSLTSFVQWYTTKSGKSVIVNPDVKGSVTVFNADVNQANIDSFFKSVLNANGFILIAGNPNVVAKSSNLNNYSSDDDSGDSSSQVNDDSSGQDDLPLDLVVHTFKLTKVRSSDVLPLIKIYIESNGGGSVTDDSGANQLVASFSSSLLPQLNQFVSAIDIPRDQVLIQSVMFDTSDSDGVDISLAAGSASGHKVAGGINTSSLSSTLSSSGGSFGIFDGNILALSLKAIQNDSHSRVISTPRILTMSGQTGYISVGKNVPFVTGKVTGEAAGVNNPFQTIERHDVGTSLKVTPVVMGSGGIVLTIDTKADSISNDAQASDIITNQRQIQTTVQIKDGQTLLLGGLIDKDDSSANQSVPFISKIPFLGWLFSSKSDSKSSRVMYVLLTAHIIRAV